MKKLENYYKELNSYMEEKAAEREMTFAPPEEQGPGKRNFYLLAAAAAFAIVPVLTVSIWRKVSYDNLIKEENRLFLTALLEEAEPFGDEEGSSDYFSDTDWFDMEAGNL